MNEMNDLFNTVTFGIGVGVCIGFMSFFFGYAIRSGLKFFEIGTD